MKSQRAFAKHCSKFVGSSSSSSYPPSPATRICLAVVTRVVLEEIKSRNLSDPNYFLSVSFLFIFVIRRESQESRGQASFCKGTACCLLGTRVKGPPLKRTQRSELSQPCDCLHQSPRVASSHSRMQAAPSGSRQRPILHAPLFVRLEYTTTNAKDKAGSSKGKTAYTFQDKQALQQA